MIRSTQSCLIVLLCSGLGAVCVSGYECLLPRAGPRGGEMQSGKPGAF